MTLWVQPGNWSKTLILALVVSLMAFMTLPALPMTPPMIPTGHRIL